MAGLIDFSQSVLTSGISLNQVQDLALRLVELHGVFMGPLCPGRCGWRPVFCCVNCATQFCVTCRFAGGTLDLTVCVVDEDIEE